MDCTMKKAVVVLTVSVVILLAVSVPLYGQYGTAYIYEKIPNSEFYTFQRSPIEGMLEFSETLSPPLNQFMVDIFMRNSSRNPINFKRAVYNVVSEDGQAAFLSFDVVEVNTGTRGALMLNPGNIIIIHCRSPIRNSRVREISIELVNGQRIRFVPYRRLSEFLQSPEEHLKNLLSGLMDMFKFTVPQGKR